MRKWRAVGGLPFALFTLLLSWSSPPAFARGASCPSTSAGGVGILKGVVTDADTGAAIPGAIVAWARDGRKVSGTTNASGAFAFAIPPETGERLRDERAWDEHSRDEHLRGRHFEEPLAITVLANPYRDRFAEAGVCPGATVSMSFRLQRRPAATIALVTGRVVNKTRRRGVSGAVVSIGRGTLPLSGLVAVTDANGVYAIPGVGFARDLTLSMATDGPPCLAPSSRPLSVDRRRVVQDFVEPEITTFHVRCPPDSDGPEVTAATGATPVAVVPVTPTRPQPPRPAPQAGGTQAADDSIQWHLASVDGIQTNSAEDAWNAGHVNAIVKVGPSSAIAASDCGGVWSLAWSSSSAAAVPVSYQWPSNCVTSLAQEPDGPTHVYAGTQDAGDAGPGGFLFETDTSSVAPLVNWVQVTPKPPCASIYAMVTDPLARRIVLACDAGIWWSPIPAAPSAHGTYNWTKAIPDSSLPAGILTRSFSGLALGPPAVGSEQATIVAGVNGGNFPNDVIYYGHWTGGNLVFDAASVPTSNILPSRTSVASCPADPQQMYAATADYNNGFFLGAVWRSVDGGQSWSAVNMPANAGNQGFYNNVLAVSPSDCLSFALGWRDHVFASFDAGSSYTPLDVGCNPSTKLCNGHLHTDYHAVLFDPADPTTVFVGSDGGIASATGVVNGGTPVVASYFNEHLPNLEFGSGDASPVAGTGLDPEAGMLTGALQDNGVLFNDLLGAGRWLPVLAGDGRTAAFEGVGPQSAGDMLVRSNNAGSTTWGQSVWDGSTMTDHGAIPVTDGTGPRDPAGVQAGGPGVVTRIDHPSFGNAQGELMYAVGAGSSDPSLVYGLFANSDGSDNHWEPIASVGSGLVVTALSSANGTTIFAGTDQGTISSIQPGPATTGTAVQLAIQPPSQGIGSIRSIVELFGSIGFAATSSGAVLGFQGNSWTAVGGLPSNLAFNAVAAPDLGSVFAANRQQVWVSHDLGGTWLLASDGLPAVAQGESLRYVRQADGSRYLYLATYGWSVFRALLP